MNAKDYSNLYGFCFAAAAAVCTVCPFVFLVYTYSTTLGSVLDGLGLQGDTRRLCSQSKNMFYCTCAMICCLISI